MSISEFAISWRTDAGLHHLRIDADGALHVDDNTPVGAPTPRKRATGPARRGKVWTPEEEEQLRAGFAAGEAPQGMAAAVGRSAGAVVARLVLLGLLDAEEAGLRYPVVRPASSVAPE